MTGTIIVKHSERSVRKPCKACGTKELYWAHDTSLTGFQCDGECGVNGRLVPIDKTAATRSAAPGDRVTESVLHSRTCPGRSGSTESTPDPEVDVPTTAPEIDAKPSVSVPSVSVPASKAETDAAALIRQALGLDSAPVIDVADIDRIITERFNAIVFPTNTVVIRDEVSYQIEGKTHPVVANVIKALSVGEHVMAVGPAGTGKSTIGRHAAEGLGRPFYSISLGPTTSEHAFNGYKDANGTYHRTPFREAYENGGVFLFDEIDNGNAGVLTSMNEALANDVRAFPDGMVRRHPDFVAIASANTYGRGADRKYVGRQKIDAATLDRFTILDVDYDEALESEICHATGLDTDRVIRVLTLVRKYRATAAAKSMDYIFGIRASVGMCKLLTAGFSWDEALAARVRRGMSDADWSKLNAA